MGTTLLARVVAKPIKFPDDIELCYHRLDEQKSFTGQIVFRSPFTRGRKYNEAFELNAKPRTSVNGTFAKAKRHSSATVGWSWKMRPSERYAKLSNQCKLHHLCEATRIAHEVFWNTIWTDNGASRCLDGILVRQSGYLRCVANIIRTKRRIGTAARRI